MQASPNPRRHHYLHRHSLPIAKQEQENYYPEVMMRPPAWIRNPTKHPRSLVSPELPWTKTSHPQHSRPSANLHLSNNAPQAAPEGTAGYVDRSRKEPYYVGDRL